MWDVVVGQVEENLPDFNPALLEYRQNAINKSCEYLDTVFSEVVKHFKGKIEYVGHEIVPPEERMIYQLERSFIKGKVDIGRTELSLVRFNFRFENRIYPAYMYIPYITDHAVVIKGTPFYVLYNIAERVASRVQGGITVSVMRSFIHFWRNHNASATYVCDRTKRRYHEAVITMKAHNKEKKSSKKELQATPLLYLIASFGYDAGLQRLGFTRDQISFVEANDANLLDERHLYFRCISGLYIKVKIETMDDPIGRSIVSSLYYMLNFFTEIKVRDLYDQSRFIWEVMLGKATHGMKIHPAMARNNAVVHLESFSHSLDPLTKTQLDRINIKCEDIYDLLVDIFRNMGDNFTSPVPSNLYYKRITVYEAIYDEVVRRIFNTAYAFEKDDTRSRRGTGEGDTFMPTDKSIQRNFINKLGRSAARFHDCTAVVSSPTQVHDNALIAVLASKIRHERSTAKSDRKSAQVAQAIIKSPEYKLDPSTPVVESILGLTGFPAKGGTINPYLLIDDNGCIIKPEGMEELDMLHNYHTTIMTKASGDVDTIEIVSD